MSLTSQGAVELIKSPLGTYTIVNGYVGEEIEVFNNTATAIDPGTCLMWDIASGGVINPWVPTTTTPSAIVATVGAPIAITAELVGYPGGGIGVVLPVMPSNSSAAGFSSVCGVAVERIHATSYGRMLYRGVVSVLCQNGSSDTGLQTLGTVVAATNNDGKVTSLTAANAVAAANVGLILGHVAVPTSNTSPGGTGNFNYVGIYLAPR